MIIFFLIKKETKNGNMHAILDILRRTPDFIAEDAKAEIKKKKGSLFNKKGVEGWNSIHFAVYFGYLDIFKYFIDK